MIPIIYDLLLLLMLIILYQSGKGLQRNGGKILSKAGISAILAFTLNEGLRFGRGTDYNLYGILYESLEKGGNVDKDPAIVLLMNTCVCLGWGYQFFVIIASFILVVSVLFFLRRYVELLPLSLPLFLLLTRLDAENLICWYMGFSFILLGFSRLLENKIVDFAIFSILSLTFHMALFPIPFLLYTIHKLKKPLFKPLISIFLYLFIGLFFSSDYMLGLIGVVNLVFSSGRFEEYTDNTEYWLTEGAGGRAATAFPSLGMSALLIILLWYGYKVLIYEKNTRYTCVYNLFLVAVLINPIASQIEMLYRYGSVLITFRAVVCAMVLYYIHKKNYLKRNIFTLAFVCLIGYIVISFFKAPFDGYENSYLFIWDKGNKTYEQMKSINAKMDDERSNARMKKYQFK